MTATRKKFKNILLNKQLKDLKVFIIAYNSNKALQQWNILKLNKAFFLLMGLSFQSGSLNLYIPRDHICDLKELEKNNIIPLFYCAKNDIFLPPQIALAIENNIINNFLAITLLYKKFYLYYKIYAQLKLKNK